MAADSSSNLSSVVGLLKKMEPVSSHTEETLLISTLASVSRPTVLSFLNQHAVNVAIKAPAFREHLLSADVLLRDGVGVELAMVLLGQRPGLNLNGTDFIPKLLKATRGKAVAVIGTRDPWLTKGVARMRSEGFTVTTCLDGFREEDVYVEAMRQARPDIVVLAMGMPRQEIVAARLSESLDHPCLIINGGAIIDFYGDRFPRAPDWARRLRLEWVYRLLKEPKRLWSRYLVGGLVFGWNLMKIRLMLGGNRS